MKATVTFEFNEVDGCAWEPVSQRAMIDAWMRRQTAVVIEVSDKDGPVANFVITQSSVRVEVTP